MICSGRWPRATEGGELQVHLHRDRRTSPWPPCAKGTSSTLFVELRQLATTKRPRFSGEAEQHVRAASGPELVEAAPSRSSPELMPSQPGGELLRSPLASRRRLRPRPSLWNASSASCSRSWRGASGNYCARDRARETSRARLDVAIHRLLQQTRWPPRRARRRRKAAVDARDARVSAITFFDDVFTSSGSSSCMDGAAEPKLSSTRIRTNARAREQRAHVAWISMISASLQRRLCR